MKQSVLSMTQDILSSLSSDEVNSIGDTTESLQIANILKQVFNNIVARGDFGEHTLLFQLVPSTSTSIPVTMQKPDNVTKIDWIKYFNPDDGMFSDIPEHGVDTDIVDTDNLPNTQTAITSAATAAGGAVLHFNPTPTWISVGMDVSDLTTSTVIPGGSTVIAVATTTVTMSNNAIGAGVGSGDKIQFGPLIIPQFYEYVTILPIDQFLDWVSTFNSDDDDVAPYTFQGFNLRMKVDKKPQFCTVIQDQWILFDSYQSQLDDTLQASKTMCKGQLLPTFTLQDNFIPNLDDKQFPLLVNEAKALAYYELRQMPHQKAEQEAKRHWAVAQKNRSVVNKPSYFEALPDYGRRSWGASWSPYVWKSSRRYDTSAGS